MISFGDGILTGEIIDVKEDGNRLIQFRYEGIFEEILDQLWTDAASALYYAYIER